MTVLRNIEFVRRKFEMVNDECALDNLSLSCKKNTWIKIFHSNSSEYEPCESL